MRKQVLEENFGIGMVSEYITNHVFDQIETMEIEEKNGAGNKEENGEEIEEEIK